MKKISFILIALFISNFYSVNAQTDPNADVILKAVSAKYKSYKTLSASFKLVIDNEKEKTKENQTGNITIKENKYKLEMDGQEVISDGKTIWTFLKEENEVQINDATTKKDAITPSSIFTIYEKGFKSKYIGEKTEAGKTIQQIELVPEDAKKPYFKIQLYINKEDKYVASAKVLNRNAIHLSYAVDKFSPDAPADDALFTFDKAKHPGVEVVDLR
ncbi:MAG TPA: outer membrane lipoprotein carrier protein LolA [Bacteroidia bacterium]|nr:outer membrane lipoprotein carrier protein LolA [Bacteroidia bacterium]